MDDAQREVFRQRLLAMHTRLTGEVGTVKNEIPNDISPPGELSAVRTHPADRDVEMLGPDLEVAQTEVDVLEQLAAALKRIEAGTFAQCVDCGRAISAQRLHAVPYTPYCIECARRHDQQRKSDEAAGQHYRDALID